MMNLFQLQEQLKDFSKDQLVREMQSPSGNAPPFLVMTELQRRSRMENAAALDKGPPTSTVAQDTVNAAGVPQGGIADMARSLAPQTDMTQNTGMVTPQAGVAMQGAAPVQAMQEGGLAGISRNVGDYYSQAAADMALDNRMNSDARASAVDRGPSAFYAAKAAEGRATPEDLALLDRQARSAGMDTASFIQAVLSGDPAPALEPEPRPYAMDQMIAGPMSGKEVGDGPADVTLPDRLLMGQRGAGAADFTPRPDTPTGLGGLGDIIARTRATEQAADIGARRGPPEQSAPGPVSPDTTDYFAEARNAAAATAAAEDRQLLERQARSAGMDPDTFTDIVTGGGVPYSGRVTLPQFLADMAFDKRVSSDQPQAPTPEPAVPLPSGMYRSMDEVTTAPPSRITLPQFLADMAFDKRVSSDQPQVPPAEVSNVAPGSYGRTQGAGEDTSTLAEIFSGSGTGGNKRRGTGGYRPEDPLTPTEDLAAMTADELLPAPPTPEVIAPETPTGSATTSGSTSGTTSGATVGGMPVPPPQTAEDRMLQQDKWLALARFGAALSSSQAPTFGQALGQATQVGLDALGQARQDFLERKKAADDMALARATLAVRAAGRGGSGSGPQFGLSASAARGLSALDDEIARTQQDLMEAEAAVADATGRFYGSPTAEQTQAYNILRDRVVALKAQRSAITRFGAGLPPSSGVAPPPPIGYDISD